MADKTKQSNSSQLEALSAAINDLERKAQHVGTMSQNDKNALAGALLEAIFHGLNLDSGPLLNMAIRRYKIMVEHGAWSREYIEKIKAVCMISLRNGNRSLLAEIIPVYQPMLLNNPELIAEGINDLGMIACLAIKSSYDEVGENCARIIMKLDKVTLPDKSEISDNALQILKNIMITAARARNEGTFRYILRQIIKGYDERVVIPSEGLLSEFYLTVLFAAADHRWNGMLPIVNEFITWMLRRGVLRNKQKKKIVYEWVQLIGQIARRNWPETAQNLMWSLFKFVVKSRDKEVLLYAITLMGSSIKMHAAWDGFDSAFAIYYPWQLAMLILLDRYFKQNERKAAESAELAKVVVRTMRDLVLHVSRLSLNKPETDVFNHWFELWEKKKAPRHIHLRAQKMLQLTVLYWEQLHAKASKNQMPYMIKIFQPNLMDAKSKALLAE